MPETEAQDRQDSKAGKLPMSRKISFSLVTLLLFLTALELLLRGFVQPSKTCYGTLFGLELPPFPLTIDERWQSERNAPGAETAAVSRCNACRIGTRGTSGPGRGPDRRLIAQACAGEKPLAGDTTARGKNTTLTHDDLFGINREDDLIGYAPQENACSPHNWWRSNNLGARSSVEVNSCRSPGKKRAIFFGDSFTNCSRVPQDATWTYYLERENRSLEALNFGVDGYGLCQILLRYRNVRSLLEYDAAVLVFVPSADMERDINTYRKLFGWNAPRIMPRFILRNGELQLIKGPYETNEAFLRANRGKLSRECLAHLEAYDSYYFKTKYESPPLVGGLILYKLIARLDYRSREKRLGRSLMEPGSEAMKLSRKMISEMSKEAEADGAKFLLFILPHHDDIGSFRGDSRFRKSWQRRVSYLCDGKIDTVDLMEELSSIPDSRFDTGYDGTHYGPESNRIIAGMIARSLKKRGICPPLQ